MDKENRRAKPDPIKLFCGLIGSRGAISEGVHLLVQRLGDIDCESRILPFSFTDYYQKEMGGGLLRKWVAFRTLRERAYLPLAKHITIAIEDTLSSGDKRAVNIDPGYVDHAQVVLSTAKNYAHRIYIGMGYYAEVTLIYVHKDFKPLEWTYPDYKNQEGLEFFRKVRDAYHSQVKSGLGT